MAFEKEKLGGYNIGGGEDSISDLTKGIISLTGLKSGVILVGKDTDRPFKFVLFTLLIHLMMVYHGVSHGLNQPCFWSRLTDYCLLISSLTG
ncbi:hypothetical protein ACFLVG_03625 [Chloroflexota bacterium]